MCVIYFVIFFLSALLRRHHRRAVLAIDFSGCNHYRLRSLSIFIHVCWADCVDFACCRLAIDMLHVCERRASQKFHLRMSLIYLKSVYCCPIYSLSGRWCLIRIPLIRRKICRMHFYILRISKCIAFSKLENRFDQSVSFLFFSFFRCIVTVAAVVLVAIMIVLWLLLSFAGHFFRHYYYWSCANFYGKSFSFQSVLEKCEFQ